MGRDKALVEIDGRALARIAADALHAAGATDVIVIGGDREGLGALDLQVHADDHPGEGPLGAIITALGRADPADAPDAIVMVLACDMPAVDAATVAAVVDALAARPDADAAVPMLDGRRQILTAAYRRRLRRRLAEAFAAGERGPRHALEGAVIVEVDGLDPERLADVDRPEDLHRYAHPHTSTGPTGASRPERGPQ